MHQRQCLPPLTSPFHSPIHRHDSQVLHHVYQGGVELSERRKQLHFSSRKNCHWAVLENGVMLMLWRPASHGTPSFSSPAQGGSGEWDPATHNVQRCQRHHLQNVAWAMQPFMSCHAPDTTFTFTESNLQNWGIMIGMKTEVISALYWK